MSEPDTSEVPDQEPDHIVCPGCLHENTPERHFCEKCGAPISSFSTMGPFEQIYSEGYAFRRAAFGPTRLIVVIGMWLLFFPGIVLFCNLLPQMVSEGQDNLPGAGIFVALNAVYLILLYRVTRNYIKRRREQKSTKDADG